MQEPPWMPRTEEEYQRQRAEDFEAALGEALDALKDIRACAHDRLAEIGGDTDTYEDAFRKLTVAAGALKFIEQHATQALL